MRLKNVFCWIWLSAFFLAIGCFFDASQAKCAVAYDTIYLPINAVTLRSALENNSRNATTLYTLLQRAENSNLDAVAFKKMDELRVRQPNNATVLAAYCLQYDIYLFRMNANSKVGKRSASTQKDYDKALSRAYALNPKLWLTYVVEGNNLLLRNTYDKRIWGKGLQLLQQAVELAPNVSYAGHRLAKGYINLADRGTDIAKPYAKAAEQLEKAIKLQPISADAAFDLYRVYTWWMPNRTKARRVSKVFLSRLPPNYKIGPKTRKFLSQYS